MPNNSDVSPEQCMNPGKALCEGRALFQQNGGGHSEKESENE